MRKLTIWLVGIFRLPSFACCWILCLAVALAAEKQRDPFPRSKHTEGIQAVLSESLRSRRVQACQGQRVTLKCPPHTHILIENTFYGRLVPSSELCPPTAKDMKKKRKRVKADEVGPVWDQPYEDTACDVSNAHSKIAEKCQNRRRCKVQAKTHLFGLDPCPTTSKYLQVSYKCKPSQFNSEIFCEGEEMVLSCRPRRRLAIYSAVYGRNLDAPSGQCVSPNPVSYDCSVDSLLKVLRLCHAQSQCSLAVQDVTFGNPCPFGVQKFLSLIFMCVNENIFNEVALEGRLDGLGSGEGEDAEVSATPTPPISFTSKTPPVNNDAAYVPVLPDFSKSIPKQKPPVTEAPISVPSTCLPPSIPNAIGFLHNWLETWYYLKNNKEKFVLYFCLSASGGLIVLLAFCIAQQCLKPSPERESPRPAPEPNTFKFEPEPPSITPTMFDSESRVEMAELGRNGVSFMRFNHPTPPRNTHTLHHYYS